MMNLTKNELLIHLSGDELHQAGIAALRSTLQGLYTVFDASPADLPRVTMTKGPYRLAFNLVMTSWLAKPHTMLDEAYLRRLFAVATQKAPKIPMESYEALTGIVGQHDLRLRHAWHPTFKSCCGAWLLALHEAGVLTLPFSFSVPRTYDETRTTRVDYAQALYGPIVGLCRSIRSTQDEQADPAFEGLSADQRELLISYGTKTLIALGWRQPADINLDELLRFRRENDVTGFAGKNSPPPYRLLIDVLTRKYPAHVKFTMADWEAVVQSTKPLATSDAVAFLTRAQPGSPGLLADLVVAPESLLDYCIRIAPAEYAMETLGEPHCIPGFDVDVPQLAKAWHALERAYLSKLRKENYKTVRQTLGYLNIYLFAYLACWYSTRQAPAVPFPDEPSKLLGGVFFSRLMPAPEGAEVPLTFMEFLTVVQQAKEWSNEYVYALLKQLEGFFDYLERFADELPGCAGFRQPVSEFDYPMVSRSSGTTKGFIPRAAFAFVLAYVEAVAAFTEAFTQRVLSGEVPDIVKGRGNRSGVIDTVADQDHFGFIPVVYWQGKPIVLRHIPNVVHTELLRLKDGRVLRLPQPHAVNQIYVALHTGLRHNHIQWLDAELFDRLVDRQGVFTRLWVNSDKAKQEGWAPSVQWAVIETLRKQREWRDLIGEPGFSESVYYNNNPQSKWGKFLPLFSAYANGLPHHDSRYAGPWRALLQGAQAYFKEAGIEGVVLCRLLPPGFSVDDLNLSEKLQEYGASCEHVCELRIATDITPHSARVSVVSHLITVLPAEFIGRHVTGQTKGLVSHYVKLDPNDIVREQQLQHLALRTKADGESFQSVVAGQADPRFIKADQVNSRLAQSMRQDLPETLAGYGCVSLTLTEEGKSGMDVLTETGGRNAAFNKTEICPYGNNCPSDVLKMLKGIRRCGLCPYAVRSIDHLPAVAAKKKQMFELQQTLDDKLASEEHTAQDQEALEVERQRINEELTGWVVVEEILETARARIAEGADTRRWVVQKPEIIEQDLRRVAAPTEATQYVLARLAECAAYPTLDSPQIRSQFDMLRRQMAARLGRFKEAFDLKVPANPAQECAGLLRSLVEAYHLGYDDIVRLLNTDEHLAALPVAATKLLEIEHV